MKKGLGLLAAALPGLALAAGDMKPGNYEYTIKMEMPGMPFAMPAQTVQQCLKKEDIDQGNQYKNDKNQQCETKNLKQSAGKARFEIACKDGTTGTAEYTFTDTSMTGKTVMNMNGQTMTTNIAAKRLGDCK